MLTTRCKWACGLLLRTGDRDTVFESLLNVAGHRQRRKITGVVRALQKFAQIPREQLPSSNVQVHAEAIERLMDGDSLEEVAALLRLMRVAMRGSPRQSLLRKRSPTSAGLIWNCGDGPDTWLADVFRMELVVSLQCCAHPDFPEGVRALLVDKDNTRAGRLLAQQKFPRVDPEHFREPWSSGTNEANPLADL